MCLCFYTNILTGSEYPENNTFHSETQKTLVTNALCGITYKQDFPLFQSDIGSQTYMSGSVAVLAETSLKSPRKHFFLIIKKHIFRLKVNQEIMSNFEKKLE